MRTDRFKVLIQIPILLLGACVPIQPQPQPNIYIYTLTDDSSATHANKPRQLEKPAGRRSASQKANAEITCRKVKDGKFKAPTLDLSKIPEDDDGALIAALMDHISDLRKELDTVTVTCKPGS